MLAGLRPDRIQLNDPGYTLDVVYPSRFVAGQSPLQLQWVAACAGASAGDPAGEFSYLDLGCGDGSTINLLADCYPQAQFVGIDVNEEHLARGREQARQAGLGNVSFLAGSFEALGSLDLPQFEYIATSGVYSWIPRTLREPLTGFAESRLRPGGLFGIHYSSLPGAAVSDSVIGYLQTLCATREGSSMERLEQALGDLQKLQPAARFFAGNPQAAELIAFIRSDPANAVHDVLNRRLPSLHFSDVHRELSARGLEFLGSGNLLPDYPELMMTREAYGSYAALTDGADLPLREATRDLMANTARRFDVYRKPESGDRQAERTGGLGGLGGLFLQRAMLQGDLEARRRFSGRCAVDLASALCTTVLDLAERPSATIADVLDSAELGDYARADVQKAIERLFVAGFLYPAVRPPIRSEYRSDRHYRLTSGLNEIRLQDSIHTKAVEHLASPVLGSAIKMPQAGRLGLLALTGHALDAVWEKLTAGQRPLTDTAGVPIADREQFEKALPRFAAETLPQLLRIGIVEERT